MAMGEPATVGMTAQGSEAAALAQAMDMKDIRMSTGQGMTEQATATDTGMG